MLRDAMDELGLDASELRVIEVLSDDDAERLEFPGSPTIRVNGVDIQDPDGRLGNLTCRVYRKRDGRVSPLPDVDDLRDALSTPKKS